MSSTEDARDEAKLIATKVTQGSMDPLLACIEIVRLRRYLPELSEEDWDLFIAIESELDGVPVGQERVHWDPKVLADKDKVTDRYREAIRDSVLDAFDRVLIALSSRH
jgi:hypothetical protein